jgi:hypothetical protein
VSLCSYCWPHEIARQISEHYDVPAKFRENSTVGEIKQEKDIRIPTLYQNRAIINKQGKLKRILTAGIETVKSGRNLPSFRKNLPPEFATCVPD